MSDKVIGIILLFVPLVFFIVRAVRAAKVDKEAGKFTSAFSVSWLVLLVLMLCAILGAVMVSE